MVDLAKLGLRPEEGIDPKVKEAVFNSRMSLDRPIPGESLTNDPNSPQAFEKAPEYTDRTEALEYLFKRFISEDVYRSLMSSVLKGVPIMSLTEIFLYKGFTEGKWNPDLIMMLAEPTAYMIMALAERADIDYVMMPKDEEDEEEELEVFDRKYKSSDLKQIDSKVSKSSLPKEVLKKLESMPDNKSLLAQ